MSKSTTATDWLALDRAHVWHPYTQMATAPTPLPIARGEGVYLITPDGRRVLDGISSWWVNVVGHSHPRVAQALKVQVDRLQQVIFAGATHEPAARLAAQLADWTPTGLDHVFYSDDGSTAVEVALKLVAQSWRHRGQPQRTLFVALTNAYHGDTFGAMAAGGVDVFHQAFEPLLFEVRRVDRANPADASPAPAQGGCDGSLAEVLERDGDRIAGVIVEPMLQGAGGMVVWPASFLRDVRALCDTHGVPLIADEIFTGFGRTGRTFACQHGPIRPDVICLSKALTGGFLPLAVTLCTDELYESFLDEDRGKAFFHGHSYTANALACAVALETLAVLREEGLLDRVTAIEARFRRQLARFEGHPRVESTRCLGDMAALVLRGEGGYLDDVGPRLHAAFLERDILLRPLGNVLYFLPPYVITDDEIDHVFDVIDEVLTRTP